jgi:hypothetical protein
MADYRLNGLLWAAGLVIGGLVLLLFNFDLFGANRPEVRYLVAGGLGLAGVGFFGAYLTARQHWWRLIPAWTLLALAGMVLLNTLGWAMAVVQGALLFVGLALAFAHIYLLDRSGHWWAIIPGGFMLVLGGVVALSEQAPLPLLGGLLFAGMGVVFGLVYLLGDRRRQWWALVPATILLIFGLFVFAHGAEEGAGLLRWWPLLLVLLGLYIGWQSTRRSPPERLAVEATPATLGHRGSISQPASAPPARTGALGDYKEPAPGASVEVLSDEP